MAIRSQVLYRMVVTDLQSRLYHLGRHFKSSKTNNPPALSMKYSSAVKEGTLKYQDSLPKYPVPPLHQTLQKYLLSYKPHVSVEEYERTKKVVEEFGKPGGTGELLQKRLEQRREETENWLSDWWRDYWLQDRGSNVLRTAPCSLVYRKNISGLDQQIDYAAKSIAGIAQAVSLLARHEFPPAMLMGKPQCMDQFYKSICNCRIPSHHLDTIFYHPVDTHDGPLHIVVMWKNYLFKFDILDQDKLPIRVEDVHEQLHRIVNSTKDRGVPIGLLTSQPRNIWADVYSTLIQGQGNAQSIHDIQSSIFFICLDETMMFDSEEEKNQYDARWALCGGGSNQNSGNRWFDKFMIFIGSHGESGLIGDHSMVDGVLAQILMHFTSKYTTEVGTINTDSSTPNLPPPKKLEFALNEDIIDAVEDAAKHIDQFLSNYQFEERFFRSFGKNHLRNLKINPDGFIQLAIQLTYYRMFGFLPVMYEASSMQAFKLGRIEHLRTVTSESAEFITTFSDEETTPAAKVNKLHEALKEHRQLNIEAKLGQGMERHLFGLQKMAEESGVDASALFEDPSWERSNHIHIKTANIPGQLIRATYSPRVYQPQSFSMWYSINDEYIQFTMNTTEDKSVLDTTAFIENLFISLVEMKDLIHN